MDNASQIIPEQIIGRSTDFTHSITFDDIKAAHLGYQNAVSRLLSINHWHEYAGFGSAKFTLCNNEGDELTGFAVEGNFVNINLPITGPDAGDGLEWVMVEKIVTEGDAHSAQEYIAMTLRPVPDPRKPDLQIAHFYTDASTNTFIVRRDGRLLNSGAHGRNEVPNNEDVDLHDKIRNTAIGLSARAGFSGAQWQKLVNGILEFEDK